MIDEDGNKVTLKELTEIRISHLEKDLGHLQDNFNIKIAALEKATSLVAENMREKFSQQNEWRGQSKDREEKFATKSEVCSDIDNINKSISNLEKSKAFLEGKASQAQVNINTGLAIVAVIVALLRLFIK